ncbi:DedA family protein [Alkalisalibacterium limincola]|uniref:DedA family protein n=2 Tax=Alkalisalibacterium limincola TaxID=2699169 RepID=A0A5C8KHS2_9GAMM|nr:DedA family protein [Alkalisalibacterium limincola]
MRLPSLDSSRKIAPSVSCLSVLRWVGAGGGELMPPILACRRSGAMRFYNPPMDSSTLDSLLAWIGQNPRTAGLVIFLVAFIDALLLVGLAVPALPLLFGVGTLVGLGLIDPWYAIACAAAGAFLGDALSFGVGRSQGGRLRGMWPFTRYPEWLVRGEVFFNRHGLKGILIARYVGAVRPIVPAIAGMLHMPWRRFLPVSAIAGATWGFAFIAPGWLFGAWLDLLSAVAGRLAVVLGVLLVLLGLMGLSVFALYRVLAPRAALLVERVLAWSHRHPVLGRYSSALIDPKRPESPSLALLALGLLGAGWVFFSLLLMQLGGGEPSAFDLRVYRGFLGLRNPLATSRWRCSACWGTGRCWARPSSR